MVTGTGCHGIVLTVSLVRNILTLCVVSGVANTFAIHDSCYDDCQGRSVMLACRRAAVMIGRIRLSVSENGRDTDQRASPVIRIRHQVFLLTMPAQFRTTHNLFELTSSLYYMVTDCVEGIALHHVVTYGSLHVCVRLCVRWEGCVQSREVMLRSTSAHYRRRSCSAT